METNRRYRISLLLLSNLSVERRLLLLAPHPALRQEDTSPLVCIPFPPPHRPLLTDAIGGIVFQFVALVVYLVITTEFLVRFALDEPFSRREDTEDTLNGPRLFTLDSKTKQMIFGLSLSSLCMFIR